MNSSIPNHNGFPRDPQESFFGTPGQSIGELLSATSSESPHDQSRLEDFLGMNAIVGGLMALCFYYPIRTILSYYFEDWQVLSVLAAALVFVLCYYLQRRPTVCTYVGTEGIAVARRYIGITFGPRIFRFEKAQTLDRSWARVYRDGGAYADTHLKLEWRDARGRLVHSLSGGFHEYHIDDEAIDVDVIRSMPVDSMIHFSVAAAVAWDTRMSRVQPQA